MGKRAKEGLRVVLDTNVFVSALLFRGELSKVVDWWQGGKITPVVSRETFNELVTVLSYPRFRLSSKEIMVVIDEEVLPYVEVTEVMHPVRGVSSDPEDDKFLSCAVSAGVTTLVTGDKDLLSLEDYHGLRIISVKEFIETTENL